MTNGKAGVDGNVTDKWASLMAEFDALKHSPRSDWAWEFLRRNSDYRSTALKNRQHWLTTDALARKPSIYQSTARNPVAEEWGLCTFR